MLDITLLPATATTAAAAADAGGAGAGGSVAAAAYHHELPAGLDNVLVYVYDGDAVVGGQHVQSKHVARFEPKDGGQSSSVLTVAAAPNATEVQVDKGFGTGHAAKMLIFAGKKLNEPIAWHGCVRVCVRFPSVTPTASFVASCVCCMRRICCAQRDCAKGGQRRQCSQTPSPRLHSD